MLSVYSSMYHQLITAVACLHCYAEIWHAKINNCVLRLFFDQKNFLAQEFKILIEISSAFESSCVCGLIKFEHKSS